MNEDRISVWSVTSRTALAYYALFTGQIIVGIIFIVAEAWQPSTSIRAILLLIWERTGALALASAVFAIIVVEAGGWIMVLTSRIREALRREGRKEERARWEGWNRRREEAQAQGKPFNEPPPSQSDMNT